MTREFIDFVLAHETDDTARLLLSAARYPGIDMPAAVQQIEGRRTARDKWPSLLKHDDFRYPPRLNREQASSEAAAQHKAALFFRSLPPGQPGPLRIADLTGGMGIDTFALAGWGTGSERAVEVDYVERGRELCEAAQANAMTLGADNVRCHCDDSMEWLRRQERHFDLLFVDPARRDRQGHRVHAFEDCTPDILAHLRLLQERSRVLMVKASPMIDITLATSQLGNVSDIHVVAIQGECKEVLFRCARHDGEARLHCHHLHGGEATEQVFTRHEEDTAQATYAHAVGRYLYEPHAALMKAGPFKLLSQWTAADKLAHNTHLYTSDRLIASFPGRIFRVVGETSPTRKEVQKRIAGGKAHVVTRNYPVAAAELQRQLGLKEGGELFVVATTVGKEKKAFVCELLP